MFEVKLIFWEWNSNGQENPRYEINFARTEKSLGLIFILGLRVKHLKIVSSKPRADEKLGEIYERIFCFKPFSRLLKILRKAQILIRAKMPQVYFF